MGEERSGHPSSERVSVPQAADHLGTTVDAIRKRVQRGTIPYERDEQSRVWILLDTGRPRQDATGQRQDTGQPQSDTTALISEMRGRIEDLHSQLEAERQAHAEARRIIAGLVERIPPAIEAPSPTPSEPPESPTAATPQPGRVEPQPAVQSTQAQESPEMAMPEAGGGRQRRPSERPWWRFWQ